MAEETEFVEVDSVEEFNSLDEFQPNFIRSPKVGEKVEFLIKGLKIIKEKGDLEFAFEKNGKQKIASNALSNVDYGVQLITDTGAVYWINSWSVFGQLRAIAKKLGNMKLAGLKVQIDHIANGMLEENKEKAWVVKVLVDGEFKSLTRDSNNWV